MYTRKLIDAVPSATPRTAQEIPVSTSPTVHLTERQTA
ncbi:MAG: hypothetical protein ACR5LF_14310 [Symbiopectobacterium sp.]